MRDGKAFASLSSGLLARKGQARPAMRPQGFATSFGAQDDLGWNDMGHDVPRVAGAVLPVDLAGPPPVAAVIVDMPEVIRQQEEIAREFAVPVDPVTVAPARIALVAVDDAPPAPVDEAVGATVAEPTPARRPASRKMASMAPRIAAVPETLSRRTHKAAFTLRLDTDRHLLLRLACAVQHRSAQQIVVEALDRLLADLPDVTRLANSLPKQD
jgi:hypothetical protein